MKKLFAVLLAVAMLLSLGVTAFASQSPTTGSLMILDPPDGSTYTAYKIFDAEVVEVDSVKKVVYYADPATWGVDEAAVEADESAAEGKLFIIAKDGSHKATTVDDPALYGLKFVYVKDANNAHNGWYKVEKSTGYDAARFAQYVSESDSLNAITPTPIPKDNETGEYAADLAPGYYLVKCQNPDSLALTTVKIGETVKVQNKKDMPLEKTVDTPEALGDDNNNTGVSIGDVLNYKIESVVPTISDTAESYTFVVSDTMTDGLTFGNELTVTIGTEIYVIKYTPADDANGVAAKIDVSASGQGAPVGNVSDVSEQIATLSGEIADLEDDISDAQDAVDDAQDAVDDAEDDVDDALETLTAAQEKLAAMQAALIANEYDVEIDGTTYTNAADLLDAIGAPAAGNDTASGQYLTVETAQTEYNTAVETLRGKEADLTAANTTLSNLESQKAAKEAQITALQGTVAPMTTPPENNWELVDNGTDLLSGDQVRFGWNGKTFEISIDMMSRKALAGQPVTIEYTATVNDNAVAEILQNTAVLTFGEDTNIDYRDAETDNYTSMLVIDKFETGNRSQKLAGAKFKLKAVDGENAGGYYKLSGVRVLLSDDFDDGLQHKVEGNLNSPLVYKTDGDGKLVYEDILNVYFEADANGKLKVAMLDEDNPFDANGNPQFANEDNGGAFYGHIKVEWVEEDEASEIVTDAEGRGVFGYLPDGQFELIETQAPVDYIKLEDPIPFTIDGHRATDKSLDMVQRVAALTNAANIENTPGSSLPSTGGVGATLLTIGGVALMLAAGAYLILRRKEQE